MGRVYNQLLQRCNYNLGQLVSEVEMIAFSTARFVVIVFRSQFRKTGSPRVLAIAFFRS